MIHEKPRCRPGGDRYIEVELGDGMSFELNLAVHALAAAIENAAIAGVVELIPELASLQVSYDPDRIAYGDLLQAIEAVHASIEGEGTQSLPSRLFIMPTLYFDPFTAECVEDYRANVTDKLPDPELLLDANDLPDRETLQQRHCGTDYWVAALGFWPGLCSLMPLDPRHRLVAPKYNPPRTWTPRGAIGIGGGLTCIYPDRTPGGYQIFARTPAPIWDRLGALPAFRESLALFRAGDRVRFKPIDLETYRDIEAEVERGTYVHDCHEHEVFSIDEHRRWQNSLPEEIRR